MNFCSDNASGACTAVLEAIVKANEGFSMPYGDDPITKKVCNKIRSVFETNAEIFLVSTGTSANALALAVTSPPYGAIFCHPDSHIVVDECGAPEFFTGGARLLPMDNVKGLSTPGGFDSAWEKQGKSVHQVQASAMSLTQASEAGTIYDLDTIKTLTDRAHERGLIVHMDGARFANAIVSLNCTPAEMSWKAGIDILSLGASKNGCIAAEAVIVFNKELAQAIEFHRKRSGHLFSKMRFISAQFTAYLKDDLWLKNARHANTMAVKMSKGLKGANLDILYEPAVNIIYANLPTKVMNGLEADGFSFYRSADPTGMYCRLVTSFNTDARDIDSFLESASRHAHV